MDQVEFTRRILRYLQLDLPELESPELVADRLGDRLWQYARPNPLPNYEVELDGAVVKQIFGEDVTALVFTARWDGNSLGYADRVRGCLGNVIEVDIDGRIGGALAGWADVVSTPAIVLVRSGTSRGPLIGRRETEQIQQWIEESAP